MTEQCIITKDGYAIYSYPNTHLHSFCICLYCKAGPLYEAKEENGLSHFFEHIVFKNVNRIYGGQLYQTLDRLGLSFNAGTYREMIQFTITGAPQHFQVAAQILSQIFTDVELTEEEIELERKRILAEIREANEKKELDYFAQKIIWKGTNLSRSILGKKKRLNQVVCGELEELQSEILHPDHCFFYLTGAVTEEQIEYLKDIVEKVPDTERIAAQMVQKRSNEAVFPKEFFHRKPKVHWMKSSTSELCFAFDFRNQTHNEAERSMLYDLLFSGDYSRMFVELSEKTGYVYSFDAQLEEYCNGGNLYFSFEIDPANVKKAAKKVVEILKELKEGKNICLDYVFPIYLDNGEMQLDDAENWNWTLAYERHYLNQEWDSLEERQEYYRQVTPEKIQALAKEMFQPENMTVCYKGKEKDIPKNFEKLVFGI